MTRILNTGIFVDPIGTAKKTPEEEIKEIQEVFQEMFPENVTFKVFKTMPQPEELTCFDFFVFDYGTMGDGAMGICEDFTRTLRKSIDMYPNTLFVCWSTYLRNLFEYVLQEMKDASDLLNYVVWWGEAEEQKIKRWGRY